jgi:DNA-binding transcriptional MerR regulator
VRRSKSGLRLYDESDLRWIEFIKCMRNAGLPIEQLTAYVQLFPQGEATIAARKKILEDQRAQIAASMAALQQTLDLLDHKIALYESDIVAAEGKLLRPQVAEA